jgi:hypothetical protein
MRTAARPAAASASITANPVNRPASAITASLTPNRMPCCIAKRLLAPGEIATSAAAGRNTASCATDTISPAPPP